MGAVNTIEGEGVAESAPVAVATPVITSTPAVVDPDFVPETVKTEAAPTGCGCGDPKGDCGT